MRIKSSDGYEDGDGHLSPLPENRRKLIAAVMLVEMETRAPDSRESGDERGRHEAVKL